MDPQSPQQPNAEPTPASPAPTQTSPVTPPPGRALNPQSPPGSPRSAPHKKLLIAVAAVAVLIAGLIFLFLSPWSPFVSAAPTGPALLVGKSKYVNACSVLDKEVVTKQLDIKSDVNKENTTESLAFAPANTTDKELDLLKTTGDKSVFDTCTLKLDRVQEIKDGKQDTSYINVSLTLEEYADDNAARQAFDDSKQANGGDKTLPSFKDKSFYSQPAALRQGSPVTLQPRVLHNNLILIMSAPVGSDDSSGEKNAAKLDTIVKDVVSRIDKGEGNKPKNFSGINQLGGNAFIDTCRSVNYAKVSAALGSDIEFNPQNVSGTQMYAPDDNNGKTPKWMTSLCMFSFRTQTEIDSSKDVTKDAYGNDLSYSEKFPHYLSIQAAVTESKAKAQEFLKVARDEATANSSSQEGQETKVEDVKLGDGGLKITLDRDYPPASEEVGSTSSAGQLYYVTHGANVYIISATYIQQDKPFKSSKKELSLEQAKKIYKELTIASKRAN